MFPQRRGHEKLQSEPPVLLSQDQSRHIRVTAGAEDFHPAVWSEEGGLGEELHPQDCGEMELGGGGGEGVFSK